MGPALRGFCFVLWRGIRTAGARVGRSRGHLCPPPARPRARGPCDSRRRQCQRFSLPRPPPACPGLSGRGFHSVRKTPSPAVAESGSKAVTRVAPSGFQKPGLCVHRADGAGHCASLCPCDHWVVIWSVLVSCPWVGGRRGRGQGETGPADVGGERSCPQDVLCGAAEVTQPSAHLPGPAGGRRLAPGHPRPAEPDSASSSCSPENDKIISDNIPDERTYFTVTSKTIALFVQVQRYG